MTRHNLDEQLSWLLTNAGLLIPKLPKCMTADEHPSAPTNNAPLPEISKPADRPTTHASPRFSPDASGLTIKPPAREVIPGQAHAIPRPSSLTASKPSLTAASGQILTPAPAVSQPGTFTQALKNGVHRHNP
jgi:hypothetical protein